MSLATGTSRTISAIRTLLATSAGRIVRRTVIADMFESLRDLVQSFQEIVLTRDVEESNFMMIMTGGTKAVRTILFGHAGTAGDTFLVNGVYVELTAASSDATAAGTAADPILINIKGSAELTSNEVSTQLNTAPLAALARATYTDATAGTVTMTQDMPGAAGNEFESSDVSMTVANVHNDTVAGVDMVPKAVAADPNLAAGVTMSVSADVGNAVTITGQIVDANGADLAEATTLLWYLATDDTGQTVSGVTDGGIAMGTDGTMLVEFTANVVGWLVTEADGDFDVVITDAGNFTSYFVVILASGRIVVSAVVTHTA